MKSIIATTVSLFLAWAGAAAAQQAMHQGHKDQLDTNNNGTVSQQEYQSFMTNAFKNLDADKNGSLSQTETADVLNASQFAATDENKDGRVSRSEFMNRVMQDFAAADKSGDGHLQ
ncbi:EF-hand domain-containing protein [Phyllobacterium sp. K27]